MMIMSVSVSKTKKSKSVYPFLTSQSLHDIVPFTNFDFDAWKEKIYTLKCINLRHKMPCNKMREFGFYVYTYLTSNLKHLKKGLLICLFQSVDVLRSARHTESKELTPS